MGNVYVLRIGTEYGYMKSLPTHKKNSERPILCRGSEHANIRVNEH